MPSDTCVICDTRPATTRDHLPPAGIFPRPRPSDLLTVPCCRECNGAASGLDERFRVFLSMHVAFTHPEQSTFYNQNVLPTLGHNRRLRREILDSAEEVRLQTASGLDLGTGYKMQWDSEAHDLVLERMIRGFHWHHTGVILGQDAIVKVQYLSGMSAELAEMSAGWPLFSIGDGALLYKTMYHDSFPLRSAWVFQFFDRKWSSGYTEPQVDDAPSGCV